MEGRTPSSARRSTGLIEGPWRRTPDESVRGSMNGGELHCKINEDGGSAHRPFILRL
jgi:hypothetical protein